MRRIPLLSALAAQIAAGAIVFGGAIVLTRVAGVSFPLLALLAAQGVAAALLGSRFGLASWWVPLHLVLPSGVAAGLFWQVPGWIFLAAFLGLVLVFWNAALGGVPLYLTNRRTMAALARLLPEKRGFRFVDLGSGLGQPAQELAKGRPDGQFTGIESAPLLFVLTWLRLWLARSGNVRLRYGDYRSLDLASYDVVYCFLSPTPMPALFEKARLEMTPGGLLISNTFIVPDHPADETVDVGDGRQTRLYLWRM